MVLEIGLGDGVATAAMAAADPDTAVLAVDVHTPGVGDLLARIDELGLTRVRVIEGDALRVLRDQVPPDSLAGVRSFFPDPWPKARHHKRRLVGDRTLDRLATLLRPGGELRLATDDEDYLVWMLDHLWRHRRDFRWTAEKASDWQRRDWPETRYEAKARAAGRKSTFLSYRREG